MEQSIKAFACSATESIMHSYNNASAGKAANIFSSDAQRSFNDHRLFTNNSNHHYINHSNYHNMGHGWMVNYAAICHNTTPAMNGGLSQKPSSLYLAAAAKASDPGQVGDRCTMALKSSKAINNNQHHNNDVGVKTGPRKVSVIVRAASGKDCTIEGGDNRNYIYNPLPIRKKSKKKLVPVNAKDGHYWMLRIKNNISAKKSREHRRKKEIEVIKTCDTLVKENDVLKRENTSLKATLFAMQAMAEKAN